MYVAAYFVCVFAAAAGRKRRKEQEYEEERIATVKYKPRSDAGNTS